MRGARADLRSAAFGFFSSPTNWFMVLVVVDSCQVTCTVVLKLAEKLVQFSRLTHFCFFRSLSLSLSLCSFTVYFFPSLAGSFNQVSFLLLFFIVCVVGPFSFCSDWHSSFWFSDWFDTQCVERATHTWYVSLSLCWKMFVSLRDRIFPFSSGNVGSDLKMPKILWPFPHFWFFLSVFLRNLIFPWDMCLFNLSLLPMEETWATVC